MLTIGQLAAYAGVTVRAVRGCGSRRVTIEGNSCEDIAAQCLIAEGPVLPGEGVNGPGRSADWIFFDNYCDAGAAQAVQLIGMPEGRIILAQAVIALPLVAGIWLLCLAVGGLSAVGER